MTIVLDRRPSSSRRSSVLERAFLRLLGCGRTAYCRVCQHAVVLRERTSSVHSMRHMSICMLGFELDGHGSTRDAPTARAADNRRASTRRDDARLEASAGSPTSRSCTTDRLSVRDRSSRARRPDHPVLATSQVTRAVADCR